MLARPPIVPILASALSMVLVSPPLAAQDATPRAARSWSDYRLGQFISSRGRTPGDILALDNNGEILLTCRDGCTAGSLQAAGVPALASQLELLRGWALLVDDEAGLRTAIPIVEGAGARLLEERADELAASIAGSTTGEVADVVAGLEAEGWRDHAYGVVFSYVLDGEVWEFFDEMSLVKRRNVSRGGAPWGGEAWAYVSAREREPRTSTLSRDSITVKVTWVEALEPSVAALFSGPLSLQKLFADFLEKGQPASPELEAKLMEYGILGPEQRLAPPVIEESRGDALFEICGRLTTKVAEAVIAGLDRPALVADLGLESESQALVIGYHEVMWRLMERWVESGAIELPGAIADPENARAADIGQLVVMTRSGPAAPPIGDRDEE